MNRTDAAIQAPLDSPLLDPETQVISAEGWYQILTPSEKSESVNEVILSHAAASDMDGTIARVRELYKRHGVPFKWSIGPMSAGEPLESKIAPLAATSWSVRGMAIDATQTLSIPKTVTVERVAEANFMEFIEVFTQGWGIKPRAVDRIEWFRKIILSPGTKAPYFLARLGRTPVGAAGTMLKDGYGYLVGAVVLEEHRGCGAYRALIQSRLQDLAMRGMPFAVTQAREATSAPILEKLGFETVFRSKIYKFDA